MTDWWENDWLLTIPFATQLTLTDWRLFQNPLTTDSTIVSESVTPSSEFFLRNFYPPFQKTLKAKSQGEGQDQSGNTKKVSRISSLFRPHESDSRGLNGERAYHLLETMLLSALDLWHGNCYCTGKNSSKLHNWNLWKIRL